MMMLSNNQIQNIDELSKLINLKWLNLNNNGYPTLTV